MPVEICLFFRRRLGASGRKIAQGVSRGADCAAGSRHGANQAAVSGNAWCVCQWGAGYIGGDADAGEGARFSWSDAGGGGGRGLFPFHAGLSCGGADVSVVDAGGGAGGTWRFERARADSDILSGALCDSGCGAAGLPGIFRSRAAVSQDDGVSTVYGAGECDRAGCVLERAIQWSRLLSEYFVPHDGKVLRVLGPAAAPLARLKKEHRFQFLLKSAKRSVMTKVLGGAMAYCEAKEIPQTAVLVDVDPLSLM